MRRARWQSMHPLAEPVAVRAQGFSLIEMLVALAVFGLAVLGLLNLAGEGTRTAALVEARSLANVVADNRAVEAMVATPAELAAMGASPRGIEQAGGIAWHWRRTLTPGEDPGIVRIDITVSPEGSDRTAAELSLFRTAP